MANTCVAGRVLWREGTEMQLIVPTFFLQESKPYEEAEEAGLSKEDHQTMMKTWQCLRQPSRKFQSKLPIGRGLHCVQRARTSYYSYWLGPKPRRAWPQPCSVMNQRLLRGEHESSLNAEVNPDEASSWNLSDDYLPPPGQQEGAEQHISMSAIVHPSYHTDLLFRGIWGKPHMGSGETHFLRGSLDRGRLVGQNRAPVSAVGLEAATGTHHLPPPLSTLTSLHSQLLGSYYEESNFLLKVNFSGRACCVFPFMWVKNTKRCSNWVTRVPHVFLIVSTVYQGAFLLMPFRVNDFCWHGDSSSCLLIPENEDPKVPTGQLCSVLPLLWHPCCGESMSLSGAKRFPSYRAQSREDRNPQNTPGSSWGWLLVGPVLLLTLASIPMCSSW